MRYPNKATVEMLKNQYPVDTRVELVKMDDEQALLQVPLVLSGEWMTLAPSWCIGTTALD